MRWLPELGWSRLSAALSCFRCWTSVFNTKRCPCNALATPYRYCMGAIYRPHPAWRAPVGARCVPLQGRHLRDLRNLRFTVGGRSSPSWVAREIADRPPRHNRRSSAEIYGSKGPRTGSTGTEEDSGEGESHHLHHLQEESPRRPDKDCQYKRGSDEEFATSMLGPAQGALACSHAVSVIQRLQPLLSEVTLSIGFESGDRRLSSRGAAQRDLELTSTRAWSKVFISATPRRRQLARWQRSLAPSPGCRS